MKLKKIILMSLVLGMCAGFVHAQAVAGTPVVYEMTFEKLEVRNTAGTWITVNDTPTAIDLADVDPEEFAGAVAGESLPVGVYNGMRSTVSMDIKIKGAVLSGGKVYYTTAEVVAVDGPNPATDLPGTGCVPDDMVWPGTLQEWFDGVAAGTVPVPDYAACIVHPPTTEASLEVEITDDEEGGGLVVAEGEVVEISFVVDVTGSIQLVDVGPPGIPMLRMFPGEPSMQFDMDSD